MTKTMGALYNGVALRPDEPLELPPNPRVRLTIESPPPLGVPESFLRTASALALCAPPIGRPT